MNKKTVDVLKGARERISSPGKWAATAVAADHKGKEVPLWSPRATRLCSTSAIVLELKDESVTNATTLFGDRSFALLDEALKKMGFKSVAELEEQGGHEKLMKVFDLAIAMSD